MPEDDPRIPTKRGIKEWDSPKEEIHSAGKGGEGHFDGISHNFSKMIQSLDD